jgi:hypothetical protein
VFFLRVQDGRGKMELTIFRTGPDSLVFHEVAHGYAAYRLGDPTARDAKRLTLNPLAHIDPMGSVLLPLFLVITNSSVLFGCQPVRRK